MIKKYGPQDFFWCFYQLYGSSLIKIDKKRTFSIKIFYISESKSILLKMMKNKKMKKSRNEKKFNTKVNLYGN